jgi:predicted DNA-binding transcriptional regulator AlpA
MAAELSVCVRTLVRLAEAGKIPKPVMLGSAKRWDRAAVLAAVERRRA